MRGRGRSFPDRKRRCRKRASLLVDAETVDLEFLLVVHAALKVADVPLCLDSKGELDGAAIAVSVGEAADMDNVFALRCPAFSPHNVLCRLI